MPAADGEFYVNSNGELTLKNAGDAIVGPWANDICCCGGAEGVPSECPGHPPLLDSYSVTFTVEVQACNGSEHSSCSETHTVTVTKVSDCNWTGSSSIGCASVCGLGTIALGLGTGQWEVSTVTSDWPDFGSMPPRATKNTGADPTGNYTNSAWSECVSCGADPPNWQMRLINVSVS